jgi:manganese/iron transport system permease protein
MVNAMWVSALTGAICAFLSCYLMLKGWSLIGDALSHSIVPGVAGAYMLGLPFAAGAFLAGGLAAGRCWPSARARGCARTRSSA